MVQKHSLTMYLYQSGLTWDERYKTSPYIPHISHFARYSQVFITVTACAESQEYKPRCLLQRFSRLRFR